MISRENIINLVKSLIFVSFSLQIIQCQMNNDKVVFQFPEYDYKETTKNELTFREYEAACDVSTRCSQFYLGIERTKCVRECISPSCYYDIYRYDELEEGEIDVRLNSFKGCFTQRFPKSRG